MIYRKKFRESFKVDATAKDDTVVVIQRRKAIDPFAWRMASTELKEHNARLTEIVCELLITNLRLPNELSRIAA